MYGHRFGVEDMTILMTDAASQEWEVHCVTLASDCPQTLQELF